MRWTWCQTHDSIISPEISKINITAYANHREPHGKGTFLFLAERFVGEILVRTLAATLIASTLTPQLLF